VKQFFAFAGGSAAPAPARERVLQPVPVAAAPPLSLRPKRAGFAAQAVVIGVSTGGPNALAALMPMFPADFRLPVLIVQHMPPIFTKLLAERLNTLTRLVVEEAVDGALVEPGKVLLAPGDYHMGVRRRDASQVVVKLNQETPENSCRPAVDVLFRSAAEVYGGAVVAVMLTGMGNDGVCGTTVLSEKGAYVIAQDEASSTVWGMPGAVVKAGLANSVVELSSVVPELLKQVHG
jgi:two-component system chemotaxis response regulator CheB